MKYTFKFSFAVAIACVAILMGCQNSSKPTFASNTNSSPIPEFKVVASLIKEGALQSHDDWNRLMWLNKVVRTLRGGQGLTPADDSARWLKMTDADVIQDLMNDPRFGNGVLNFNLFFIGAAPNALISPDGRYWGQIVDYPGAIQGAQSVVRGEDYFKFFDAEQPLFVTELGTPRTFGDEKDVRSPQDQRIHIVERLQKETNDLLALAQANPVDGKKFCDAFNNSFASLGVLWLAGSNDLYFDEVLSKKWWGPIYSLCSDPTKAGNDFATPILSMIPRQESLFKKLLTLAPEVYHPVNVTDIKTLDVSMEYPDRPWNFFRVEMGLKIVNSSTNMNRKRAAYILKRFFCDDLTPIAVEDTGRPSSGPHGSETSCYSCHYKLDPMAGHFKDFGQYMYDYSGLKQIKFDDGARVDRVTYGEAWKAPAGKPRMWDIGYIRSVRDESKNTYGADLNDLMSMLKTAPEVRRCLVRRLFEYTNSSDQVMDPGYLDELTNSFNATAQTNSSQALKETWAKILSGRTIHEPYPQKDTCYDQASGGVGTSAPPCRVAFHLQKNCASCHDSTTAFGQLDLTHWTVDKDGKPTFPHLDSAGAQKTQDQTFSALLERLSSADLKRRMPLGKDMDSVDRQTLYLWVNQTLHP